MLKFSIANPQELLKVQRERIRAIGTEVLEGEGVKNARISLAFVDNSTIHQINQRFLQHDEPTDVISFPWSRPNASCLEGELVIGVQVAEEQAKDRGHDVESEIALYIIHGLLHLCGYDDHSDEEAEEMRNLERKYLLALKYPDISGGE